MRGAIIGLAVLLAIILGVFGALAVLANSLSPRTETVRIELDDTFPR